MRTGSARPSVRASKWDTCDRPDQRQRLDNPPAIYALLFDGTAKTLMTIATDPKHLDARIQPAPDGR